MRNLKHTFLLLFFVTLVTSSFSQDSKADYLHDIQVLERKAAQHKMNYRRNVNTENYDLKYHRLEWEIDPAVEYISGTVTSYFEAKSDMSTITFDLQSNMVVDGVSQRGNALTFSQNSEDELIINLPTTLSTGVLDSLSVAYHGQPISTGFDAFQIDYHDNNSVPILGTLSEPYGAKTWWPCKQDLIDKIDSIDVYVNHPLNTKVASNGLLLSEEIGTTTILTHWKHRYPIPAYLIAIACSNYTVYNDYVANGDFNVVNYVYPETLSVTQSLTAITPQIMDLYGRLFEMYPFADEKYGHAEFNWSGGMEHTTMTFMGGFNRGLIAHELAHQWFGNKVTCGSWQDIWLNESFATYLTELVTEDFDGDEAFKLWRQKVVDPNLNDWRCITNQANGSVYVPANDTTNVSRIFDGRLSYRKGAMVLHMLRYKLGDLNFFEAAKNYLADPALAYGYATTDNLIQHMESQSGEDLTEFFNDWFYGEGFPSFSLTYNQNDTGMLNVRVNQTQSDPSVSFFETPLPIKVTNINGNSEMFNLELVNNNQLFSLSYGNTVASIEIDPDFQIISVNNTAVASNISVLLNDDITIQPNPVKDLLVINTSNNIQFIDVVLYNNLGQRVKYFNTSYQLDVSDLEEGVYSAEINTKQGTTYKKIIKY